MLLHLSFNDSLEGILKPKYPDRDPHVKVGKYTESDLPARTCFASTIQGCFSAIYPNISKFYEEENHKFLEFQLYIGIPDNKTTFVPNDIVLKNVWDAHITGEVCVTSPIKVVRYLTLSIGCLDTEIWTRPYNSPKEKERFVSPRAIWSTLKIHKRFDKLQLKSSPPLIYKG